MLLLETFGAVFDEVNFAVMTGLMQVQRRNLRQQSSDLEKLQRLAELAKLPPDKLFLAPPLPEVKRTAVNRPPQLAGVGRNYRLERLTFPSVFESGKPNNDMVAGWWAYRPGRETAPTIIYAHGWMAYDPGMWLRMPLSWAAPLGYNVLMLELPYHMSRTPPGTRSGELSITADLPGAVVTAQQGVSDIRQVVKWLRAQGVEKIGLLGKSLGGLMSSLTVVAEPELDCAVLLIPAVDAGASLWHSTYTRLVRYDLARQGIDEAMTSQALGAMNPTRQRPAIDPHRVLIIVATADRACPPAETEKLAAAWKAPLERIPLGHLSAGFTSQARDYSRLFFAKWLMAKNQEDIHKDRQD